MSERTPNITRFSRKVDMSGECWVWTGACIDAGYEGDKTRTRTAHRVAWELANGPIPVGKMVLHTCDNRACVRPDHLYLGTHTRNMQDMIERGRAATGNRNGKHVHPDRQPRGDNHHARLHPERLARGETNGNAKMTADRVRAIRERYDAGGILLRELAAEFSCPLGTVHQIITRKTWRHV
jgi:hypothetical protein